MEGRKKGKRKEGKGKEKKGRNSFPSKCKYVVLQSQKFEVQMYMHV